MRYDRVIFLNEDLRRRVSDQKSIWARVTHHCPSKNVAAYDIITASEVENRDVLNGWFYLDYLATCIGFVCPPTGIIL